MSGQLFIRRSGSALLIAGCLFLLSALTAVTAFGGEAVVKQGVYVDGISLGGMTREEAGDAVKKHVKELAGAEVTLTIGDHTEQVPVSTFGLKWSNDEILDEIMTLGTGGNVITRYMDEKDIEHESRNYDLTFSVSKKKIRAYAEGLKQYDTEPVNATGYSIVWENTDTSVAEVSGAGLTAIVTGVSPGTAFITVTATDDETGRSVSSEVMITVTARLMGDIDANGTVNANDALLVLRAALGIITLTPEQRAAADMDASGTVTANDALMILRLTLGLIEV